MAHRPQQSPTSLHFPGPYMSIGDGTTTPLEFVYALVRRRMQNREAQRRFRERKDQQQKTLQQKAEDLQIKCQTLLDQYTRRTDEVCRLLKENDALRAEAKTLRQQWELFSTILHRSKGSRSSSVVVNETSPSPSLCSSAERSRKLDDFWRRLDDFTDDRENSSSLS
ncbi:bZIP transcription factor [Aspergillus fischeri NRRL 181]|uniref:BZIP transcription factor, putative n=1 Tax=Neosartorya fischeri (strain ATCC 1020 / DSM 3700 / CBS 544.65 / FGSC A1164 / JCM 1740 / NRRL 181 / WB 181) TaxID=331117 RepID=A1DDB6_NEOFI|nr:bZIP transcription factor, putative [Aspergillus fischeri NRRL 181]EAW17373.1 bZIP transcription factor, putative [Aspergillus fischeri NRRL 181]